MTLLEVRDLVQTFATPRGRVQAVRGVDFTLAAGETLALVGESGSGKSTTARAVARLTEPTSGQVLLDGEDLLRADARRTRELRKSVQVVFQDPYSSLDPKRTVRQAITEPLDVYRIGNRASRIEVVDDLVGLVGLDRAKLDQLPGSMSGGQRQRVAIARALALNPRLVICDEAVSALDVSVQAQVLNLLSELQQSLGIAYLFITHDLAVVSEIADMVAVMYLGRIVEIGTREAVLGAPQHPYSQALLSAAPRVGASRRRVALGGESPSPLNPPSGCGFRLRCPRAAEVCARLDPRLEPLEAIAEKSDQRVACHFPGLNQETA